MLLSSQIMSMLTWLEIPWVENPQITYCVNCRNVNIPDYCCQRSVFLWLLPYHGAFSCSVEKIKRFVSVHLHCIVSNVPSKVHKYSGIPELLRSEISFSSTCNIRKQSKLHRKQGAVWMNFVFCSYFDKIVYYYIFHKVCNSLKTPLK